MQRNIIFKFLLFYIFLTIIISYIFVYNFNNTINNYLKEKTNSNYLNFQAIYNKNKDLANIIFKTVIQKEEVLKLFKDAYKSSQLEKNILREKLLNKLEITYKELKELNLKQLHFHLPNNESFLRMHRPKKFGDNLTGVRDTVMYVNENKKYFHGFEEGRIFNGFRYVYPLFWENEHIGSVEISFSTLAITESFAKTFQTNASFIIRKDVVEEKVFNEEKKNYIQSPQKEFYYEKSVYDKYPPITEDSSQEDKNAQILKGDPFSLYIEDSNITKTIIPLKNPLSKKVVAGICICSKDNYILNTRKNLIITLTLMYLFIAIILFLFYRKKVANEKLKKLNKELDKRIEIELKKSRRKDMHIQNQSKMAAVGEMLNNIAHQWRQPLNVISTSASGLKIHKELNFLDDKTFDKLTNSINEQSQYLSKVIESFKEYLSIDNHDIKKQFCVQDRVDNALDIFSSTFEYNGIEVEKDYQDKKLFIQAAKGQLIQSLINILNNAKDALIKNNELGNRKIFVSVKETNDSFVKITIEDNAGGINKNIIEKIFEPYFTTKHESVGTGISLYMAYETITIDLHGKLYVKNRNNGAKFYIEIPLS